MSNWKKMMQSKARHSKFVGRGRKDENAYFEFFAGAVGGRNNHDAIASARSALLAFLRVFLKVYHTTGTIKLFREHGAAGRTN